jgi:hypothetical protein
MGFCSTERQTGEKKKKEKKREREEKKPKGTTGDYVYVQVTR